MYFLQDYFGLLLWSITLSSETHFEPRTNLLSATRNDDLAFSNILFYFKKDFFILTRFPSFHICRRNMCDLKKMLQFLMVRNPCLPNYHLTIMGTIKMTSWYLYQASTEVTRVSLRTNPSGRNRTNQRKQAPHTKNHGRTRLFEFEYLSIATVMRSFYRHSPSNILSKVKSRAREKFITHARVKGKMTIWDLESIVVRSLNDQ